MVQGLPDDVPQSKPHSISVMSGRSSPASLAGSLWDSAGGDKLGGISMAGMAADGPGVDNLSPEDPLALSDFVVKNRAGRSRIFFINTVNFDAVLMARRAHFDYVQGVGVAPAVAQFGTVFWIT
jgi:hypothetical protein